MNVSGFNQIDMQILNIQGLLGVGCWVLDVFKNTRHQASNIPHLRK